MKITKEKNVQIVISLMKAHGIKRVVASPGSMNYTFLLSIQDDPDFEIYSCTDERSAAYMACGMVSEDGKPVALSCTLATASRDYMPGLTEAYYRKLPILAITSTSSEQNAGQLIGQQLDRTARPKDLVVESVYLPSTYCRKDELVCEREANKAMLALFQNGGGPVHIELGCNTMDSFTDEPLPQARVIRRYTHNDVLPEMPEGRIAVMLGVHAKMEQKLVDAIDAFCATHDAIVLCVNPKSYNGKYAANAGLLFSQPGYSGQLNKMDVCIQIGEIFTDAIGFRTNPKEAWRVNEDGVVRDHESKLTKIFQMTEYEFFRFYSKEGANHTEQIELFRREDAEIRKLIPELPFSNAWIAQRIAPVIPVDSEMYLGILNSLRMFDYANPSSQLHTNANTGGFGIDGCISSMIGASIVAPHKEFYGVFGDLAFFYDMNSLGNRHIGKNLHIMLMNNDGGQQFRNFDHPAHTMGEAADLFIAAAGHNSPKSRNLVKHYAEDLGFAYVSASNKEEFEKVLPEYLATGRSIVCEIFIDGKDDGDAVKKLRSIYTTDRNIKQAAKNFVVNQLGTERIEAIKKIIGR